MKTRFFPNFTFTLQQSSNLNSKLTLIGPSHITKNSLKRFLEKAYNFNISKINTLNLPKPAKTKKFRITLK